MTTIKVNSQRSPALDMDETKIVDRTDILYSLNIEVR